MEYLESYSNLIETVSIVLALVGLFFPNITRYLQKRNRIENAHRLLELVRGRDDLNQLLKEKKKVKSTPPYIINQLELKIAGLEKELQKEDRKTPIYIYLIALEIAFLFSIITTRVSDYLTNLFYGTSGTHGFGFLEGDFGSFYSKGLLFGLMVFLSVLLLKPVGRLLARYIKSSWKLDFALWVVFHISFFILLFMTGYTLFSLDARYENF